MGESLSLKTALRGVVSAALGVFFAACGAGSPSYPSWYLKNEADSKYLYGVGEAEGLRAAKSAALNDLATKISLKLDSDLSIQKEQTNANLSSKTASNVEISVRDIELDAVEYPFVEEVGGVFFAQARLEKSKLLNKLSSELDAQTTQISGILNDIKAAKCTTISPKQKHKLANLYSEADYKSQQIRALGGAVRQSQLLGGVSSMLTFSPEASYTTLARGGGSEDYRAIDGALMGEFARFFSIVAANSGIFSIQNEYEVEKLSNKTSVKLGVSVKDCLGVAVFSESLEAAQDSRDLKPTISRLRAQLYKKLDSWVKSD